MTRILIVDDETPLAEALSSLFELEKNIEAGDRATAERLMVEEHFSVVLADVRLRSEEDGLMLLGSIRKLSPDSKIATMTGYATPALERQLRSLGAPQIIYKPIEFDELLRIIRELLGDDADNTTPSKNSTSTRFIPSSAPSSIVSPFAALAWRTKTRKSTSASASPSARWGRSTSTRNRDCDG